MAGAAGRVLVAGIGNIFCTDDGFGPAVLARLQGLEPPLPDAVRAVDYGIRGMHLAYDLLEPWDGLVLVDALPDRGEPGRLAVLELGAAEAETGATIDAHAMDPVTVLASLAALGGSLPARALLVGCQVADVGEGMGLSRAVQKSIDAAARTVLALVAQISANVSADLSADLSADSRVEAG